jgi:hypothetical protein
MEPSCRMLSADNSRMFGETRYLRGRVDFDPDADKLRSGPIEKLRGLLIKFLSPYQ